MNLWKWLVAEVKRDWASIVGMLFSASYYTYNFFNPRVLTLATQSGLSPSAIYIAIPLSVLLVALFLVFLFRYIYVKKKHKRSR